MIRILLPLNIVLNISEMGKALLIFIFVFIGSFTCLVSQNLVPNSSFELTTDCPTTLDQVYLAPPWFKPTLGSSDVFSSCSTGWVGVPQSTTGFEYARTGNNYAAFVATLPGVMGDYREYIEVRLTSPLLAGQKYLVNFYLSFADSMQIATDDIGIYFSEDSLYDYTSIAFIPTIPQVENPSGFFITNKNGWTEVAGDYIATGGENFIVIGNFKNNVSTDTTYVPGGSPNSWSYYFIDDVSVVLDSSAWVPGTKSNENYEMLKINLYPNPADYYVVVKPHNYYNELKVEILTITGQLLSTNYFSNDADIKIDVATLAKGVYLITIEGGGKSKTLKFIKS